MSAPTSDQYAVVYRVAGTGTAGSITYNTDGGMASNQETDVRLPWQKTITLPHDGGYRWLSLAAQGGRASGTISISIEVNGHLIKSAEATGYGVATLNVTSNEWSR